MREPGRATRSQSWQALAGLLLADVRAVYRRRGGWAALARVAYIVAFPVVEVHRGCVLRRSLAEWKGEAAAPPPGIAIRQVTMADAPLFGTVAPARRVRRFVAKLAQGEQCLVALAGERVVGLLWAAPADSPSARATPLHVAAGEMYLWGLYVVPQARRQGVRAALSDAMYGALRAQGVQRATVIVEQNNIAMQCFLQERGYQVVGEVVSLRLLGWTWGRFRKDDE